MPSRRAKAASQFTIRLEGSGGARQNATVVGHFSVNLDDRTRVTADDLKPLVDKFRDLPQHGAIVCMPQYEECDIRASQNRYAANWTRAQQQNQQNLTELANGEGRTLKHRLDAVRPAFNAAQGEKVDNIKWYRPKPGSHVVVPPLSIVWQA